MGITYPISNIVDLSIQLDAFPVERAGFGVPLFIGTTDPGVGQPKVAVFTSLAAVGVVYDVVDEEYKAAAAFFGQNPKPEKIAIGYRAVGENYATCLAAIREIYDGWFFLTCKTRVATEQTTLMTALAAIPGYRQAHFVSNDTANVLNSGVTTDIGSVLVSGSRLTGFAHYHTDATQYPELATLGTLVVSRETPGSIPGSVSLQFSAPAGITPLDLDDAKRTVLGNKRYTLFQNLAEQTRAFGGRSGTNVPFDVVYFMGWLSARIPEAVTEVATRARDRGEKVPFNATGIAMMEDAVRGVLNRAVTASAIEPDYDLKAPAREETLFADRVERLLNGVTFTANITGAIEKVGINGVLVA